MDQGPREKYNWRQDTPAQQMAVILQSIEGWGLNLEDGIVRDQCEAAKYILAGVEQIKLLVPYLQKGSW